MSAWLSVVIGLLVIVVLWIFIRTVKIKRKKGLIFFSVVFGLSSVCFFALRQSAPLPVVDETPPPISAEQMMSDIQDKLRVDSNNAALWFQLGQGYLFDGDFASALTSFDYANRLSDIPSATWLAAKATALYYEQNQRMTTEVSALIDAALQLETHNEAALSLRANDHFLSFRFEEAIGTWTALLSSRDPALDRVKVIHAINQAKALLASHSP